MTYVSACGVYVEAIIADEKEKKELAAKKESSLWTANASNSSMSGMPPNFLFNKSSSMPLSYDQSLNTKTDLVALEGVYNPALGEKLANSAKQAANSLNSVGRCARGVVNGMVNSGFATDSLRDNAYKLDPKLAQHKNFREVLVAREDLKNLPAGCVIVWQPSSGHANGHVAVTLGNAQEASDHVQRLIVRNAPYSVFVPVRVNFNC